MCHTSLREHSDLQVPDIDNRTPYCIPNEGKVTVQFKKVVIVSGIVLQGNSEQDGWVTGFALSYQKSKDQEPLTEIRKVSN